MKIFKITLYDCFWAKSCKLFYQKISSEMFDWILNIPLIFKRLRWKLSRSLFHVKINSSLTHSSRGCCLLCNIFKSLLKVSFFIHFYFLGSVHYRAPLLSILQYQLFLYRRRVVNVWTFKGRLQQKLWSSNSIFICRLQDIVHLIKSIS